ncbi:MAG: amidohydrolase [Deltaproteobacteria bacterium]|jgi:predicted amidohydrolase YtcJ|nr:amidohydrolase [Deltaproteobacteria bacterium]
MSNDSISILHNGKIYTADRLNSVCEAMAVKGGLVEAVGAKEELLNLYGGATLVDLSGNTVIPGIVDSHVHPFWGGVTLMVKSLDYEDLSVSEILQRLEGFIADEEDLATQDQWLLVTSWCRKVGEDPTRKHLDTLPTRRPVILFSDDCHFAALNSVALEKLTISENTPNPMDGWIRLDNERQLNGIIEDGLAMRIFDNVMRLMGWADLRKCLQKAFSSLSAQGVTTCLDARSSCDVLELATFIREQGELPLRYMGALEVRSGSYNQQKDLDMLLDNIARLKKNFDTGEWGLEPSITVEHVKFFVDGMPATQTAYLKEPYKQNFGSLETPDWRAGTWRGRPYFEPDVLKKLVHATSSKGYHPHFHVIADGAVEMVLSALKSMRQNYPNQDIRPSLAHLDLVAPDQYALMRELAAYAVLSFQWAGLSKETLDAERELFGEERFPFLETHGKFLDSGVKMAYGSDWPVEPLNEFANLQVGMTRTMVGPASPLCPRLDSDRDLTLLEVLRAATISSAESLGKEKYIGSLEPGKFADYAVVKGDLFQRDKRELHKTEVLETVVGGESVFKKEL